MRIGIVTQRREALDPFAGALASEGALIDWIATPQEAIAQARSTPRDLIVLEDQTGAFREQLSDLMMANAMIQTAVITDMAPEAFHEASEGLGVLCALPTAPGAGEARSLLDTFRQIMGL